MPAYVSAEQAAWPNYGRDAGGSRYSPLNQIQRSNVRQLKVAWMYHTGEAASASPLRKKAAFEATPLMIDGTLYLSTPFSRVIALEAQTGNQRWAFDPIRSAASSSLLWPPEVTANLAQRWVTRSWLLRCHKPD